MLLCQRRIKTFLYSMDTTLYLTVLLFLIPDQEEAFARYENHALSLVTAHGGQVVCRLRPGPEAFISPGNEQPYEVHVLSFPTSEAFQEFMQNPTRVAQAHLREQAIARTVIITGQLLQ
jgi:uncharacterized protein (DUF1330 family)